MTLLTYNEAQAALIAFFRSSALLGLVSLIFLLTILYIFSIGFRSGEFAGQSSTVTPWSLNQLLVPLAVWAGEIIISIKLVSRRKHEVLFLLSPGKMLLRMFLFQKWLGFPEDV